MEGSTVIISNEIRKIPTSFFVILYNNKSSSSVNGMKLKFSKYNFGHIFTKEQPDYSAGLISADPETYAPTSINLCTAFFLP